MRTFTRKGYGRIYVELFNDIEKVKDIIKEMDAFEFDYLPPGLITTFSDAPKLVYTGKFDALDLDLLTLKCQRKGIYIFCFNNGEEEFADYKLE